MKFLFAALLSLLITIPAHAESTLVSEWERLLPEHIWEYRQRRDAQLDQQQKWLEQFRSETPKLAGMTFHFEGYLAWHPKYSCGEDPCEEEVPRVHIVSQEDPAGEHRTYLEGYLYFAYSKKTLCRIEVAGSYGRTPQTYEAFKQATKIECRVRK